MNYIRNDKPTEFRFTRNGVVFTLVVDPGLLADQLLPQAEGNSSLRMTLYGKALDLRILSGTKPPRPAGSRA